MLVGSFSDLRLKKAVSEVCGLSNSVEEPECGCWRVGGHIAVANFEALRNSCRRCVNWGEARGCRVVHAKPYDTSNLVGKPVAGLSQHPETGLLGGNCPLKGILVLPYGKVHRTPSVWGAVPAGSHILAHIKWSSLVMVFHYISHLLHGEFVVRFYVKRHLVFSVKAKRKLEVLLGILISNFTLSKDVERTPYPCLAASQGVVAGRCVCVAEAELLVLAAEISHLPCKINHIFLVDAVLRVIQWETVYP